MFDIAAAAYYNDGNSGKRLYCAQKQPDVVMGVAIRKFQLLICLKYPDFSERLPFLEEIFSGNSLWRLT